jgi:SAM-dependent methyltransferase
MTDEADRTFTQTMSESYERLLGPAWFTPMTPFVADAVSAAAPDSVLETAAGTGILTRVLAERMPGCQIVATDLSQAMIDYGATVATQPNIAWQQADAQELPFEDGSFDVVVCQFGVMFFPDRLLGYREARRALGAGGRYVVAIWDTLDDNDVARVAAAVSEDFIGRGPTFYERVPYGYADTDQISSDLKAAGFTRVDISTASARPRVRAADVARGAGLGTPQLAEYDGDKDEVVAAITTRLLDELGIGDGETVEGKIQALVITAS